MSVTPLEILRALEWAAQQNAGSAGETGWVQAGPLRISYYPVSHTKHWWNQSGTISAEEALNLIALLLNSHRQRRDQLGRNP